MYIHIGQQRERFCVNPETRKGFWEEVAFLWLLKNQ